MYLALQWELPTKPCCTSPVLAIPGWWGLRLRLPFREHIYLRMLIVHLTMFWKHSIHTSSFRVGTKPKALSRYTHFGITRRVNDNNPCTLNHHLESIRTDSVKLITESPTELYWRIALTLRVFTCSTWINDLTFNWNRCGFRISKYGNPIPVSSKPNAILMSKLYLRV